MPYNTRANNPSPIAQAQSTARSSLRHSCRAMAPMRDDRTEAEEPAGSGLGAIGMGKRDWEIDREVEINAQSSELRGPKTQNQSVFGG